MENKSSQTASGVEKIRRTSSGRLHSPTREKILTEIEDRGSISTADLVKITGLHENTVRGHLDALYNDGYINKREQAAKGRGRPAIIWNANLGKPENLYKDLAETLLDALLAGGESTLERAKTSGEKWGAKIVAKQKDSQSGASKRKQILETLHEQGFSPREEGETILLHSCPLFGTAKQSDLVCTVHEGMVSGIAKSESDKVSVELKPLVRPGVCALKIRGLI